MLPMKAAVRVVYYFGLRYADLVVINNENVEYDNLNDICVSKQSGAMQKNNKVLIRKKHEKYFVDHNEKTINLINRLPFNIWVQEH